MGEVSYIKIVHESGCGRQPCSCSRGFGIMWRWKDGVVGNYERIDNSWRGQDPEEYALYMRLKERYGE